MKHIVTLKDTKFFKRLVDLKIVPKNPSLKAPIQLLRKVKELDLSKARIRLADDLKYFKKLERLDLSNNMIEHLDLSANPDLRYVNVRWNLLESIIVKNLKKLQYLLIDGNRIDHLFLPKDNKLFELSARKNRLSSLDIRTCKTLRVLDVAKNKLSHLDVSASPLIYLQVEQNKLTSLDVSRQRAIEYINVSHNKFISFAIPPSKSLRSCILKGNPIEIKKLFENPAHAAVDFTGTVLGDADTYHWYFINHLMKIRFDFMNCLDKAEFGRYCVDKMMEALYKIICKYDKHRRYYRYDKGLCIYGRLINSIGLFCNESIDTPIYSASLFNYKQAKRTYYEDASSLDIADFPCSITLEIKGVQVLFEMEEVALVSFLGFPREIAYVRYYEDTGIKIKARRSVIIRNT